MNTPTVYCILGMHRSGTSLTTRLLNLLGVELGPAAHIMAPNQYNPTGFWEHDQAVSLNDELLARLGGSWHSPPAFTPGWELDAELEDLRERARAIIADDFAGKPVWGIKDPRMCLVLPFWKPLMPPLRFILCLRNPADVARSLAHAVSFEQGVKLWVRYVAESLLASAGGERVFIHYENLLADTDAELRRIAVALNLPATNAAAAVEFTRADLRHHRTTVLETVTDNRVCFAAKALYLELTKPTLAADVLENFAQAALETLPPVNAGAQNTLPPAVTKVCELIHDNDPLHHIDPTRYFAWGQHAIQAIRQAMPAAGVTDFHRILDAHCGYGRITRAVRAAYPKAVLAVSDPNREAMEFCAQNFQAKILTAADSASAAAYDLIWAGLQGGDLGNTLGHLAGLLAPGGILVFATSGRRVGERLLATEPALRASFETDGLVTVEKTALLSLPFAIRAAQSRGLRVIHASERGWFNYHDIVACVPEHRA